MDFIPANEFRCCVDRYQGNRKVSTFTCWDQFLSMAFAQLTYRESLRDIEACLRAFGRRLYHLGIRGHVSRSTLADYHLHQALTFFVIRARKDFRFHRLAPRPVDKLTGLRCDQTIRLKSFYPAHGYPGPLRRIRYHDAETHQTLVFLTNNFLLPTLTIAPLYRCRWQVELFFKWIEQHSQAISCPEGSASRGSKWSPLSLSRARCALER